MSHYFEAKQMAVGYNGAALIRDIDFSLEKGEILTLIGPNGAGKSTILKSIAGQLAPIRGAAYLDGIELGQMDGHTRSCRLAVVFTDRLRTELMTCRDVVAAGRYPYTGRLGLLSAQDWQQVDEAMELVQVTELAMQDFNRISDGQRQRILLARAICQQPELLLLDEPTSYLDVKYKLDFLVTLQRLARDRQLTVIMSLHELDLAQRISDKILCVGGGHIQRFGTPAEVFAQGYIQELFDIRKGFYEESSGGVELAAPTGEPRVFVIGGGGSAANLYRRLQRGGVPFATGILYDNDLDAPTARALAATALIAPAFEEPPEELIERAMQLIERCDTVYCTREHIGSTDIANARLLACAAGKVRTGKEIDEKGIAFL